MLKPQALDVKKIQADFPILKRRVHGKRLVYLDNAATTQKPKQVIDALVDYYSNYNANVHRSVHRLGEEATEAFEASRGKIAGERPVQHAAERLQFPCGFRTHWQPGSRAWI